MKLPLTFLLLTPSFFLRCPSRTRIHYTISVFFAFTAFTEPLIF